MKQSLSPAVVAVIVIVVLAIVVVVIWQFAGRGSKEITDPTKPGSSSDPMKGMKMRPPGGTPGMETPGRAGSSPAAGQPAPGAADEAGR